MKALARLRRRQQPSQQRQRSPSPIPTERVAPHSSPPTSNPVSPPHSSSKQSPSPLNPSLSSLSSPFTPAPALSAKEQKIASALAAEVSDGPPSSNSLASPSSPSSPSSLSSPSAPLPPVDARDSITFNLQILSDHGIVLCPGFHRPSPSPFTSSTLLSTLHRSSLTPRSPPHDTTSPSLKPTPSAQADPSPTVLPPAPTEASSSSPSGPLDEVVISFGKGLFTLVDAATPTAAGGIASSSSPSLSGSSSSSSAAASSVLKRLSLPGWRSTPPTPHAGEDAAQTFPPSSALPTRDDGEEDDALRVSPPANDDDDEEPPPSVSSPAKQVSPAFTSAAPAPPSSPAPSTPTLGSASATTQASTAPVPIPSASLSLPLGLLSSIASWLFPPLPPPSEPSPPPPPSPAPPPPPPPPPPPYHSTLRRIVIMGVHGWSLLGGMLGDRPLLISSRFCFHIQAALLHYMAERGVDRSSLTVTCIPLYGHGRIEERVAMYVGEQLPLYREELAQADHVIIACHSQGCMVTSALLHSLLTSPPAGLRLGVGGEDVTVVMLAGLHHGPFPDLTTDLYPATKELFHFSHAHTSHSQQHLERMQECVKRGVKVLLVGSVHDQVVPLYSSLAHLLGASSPNVLRAVYVDYAHYQPDFLYSFLSLLLFLSNHRPSPSPSSSSPPPTSSASSSNDVLPHLSGFLRGSLLEKQGGAHSAMHRCVDVYGLGVEWAMSGRGVVEREVEKGQDDATAVLAYSAVLWSGHLSDSFTSGRLNRHLLMLRVKEVMGRLKAVDGLVEEEERRRLQSLFEQWQPRTRNLKLLKDTLQPVFASPPTDQRTQLRSSL